MLRRPEKFRPRILFVVHGWGGGTIRFARALADLVADKVDVTWAWGVRNKLFHVSERGPYYSQKSYDLAAGFDVPLRDLKERQFDRLNVIHTIGLQEHISELTEGLSVPYDVTLTDYHHFSPTPHFEDERGYFIGDDAIAQMRNAAGLTLPPFLAKADRRIAISGDLAHRLQWLLPELPVIAARVRDPQEVRAAVKAPVLKPGQPMRVLVLGRPHRAKGLSIILDVAKFARYEALPIEILCLGESSREAAAALDTLPNVRSLGAYKDTDLHDIVAQIDPHIAWLPFTVPETHSYALSDLLGLGLPILATAIGAVSERVAGRASTWLVPYRPANADDHFNWIKRLYLSGLAYPASWQPVNHLPEVDRQFYPDIYLKPILAQRGLSLRWLRRHWPR